MDLNGNLKLIFVRPVRKTNETYEYDLLFSEYPEEVWSFNWDDPNPSSCGDLTPDSTTYNLVKRISCNYELTTIQSTNCFSMEHAMHGVVALSWVNIENLEEYPPTRLVFHFGMDIEVVDSIINKNNEVVSYI